MNEVAQLEPVERTAPKALPAIAAGGQVRAIIPQSFDDAYRISQAIAISGMAPKDFQKPETILIAIMHGAEVGLPPMQALQSIAVINGRPSIWGDGALGLVRGSGLLEWIEEVTEGSTAICRLKRKGEPKQIERRFSDEDAKAAGLLNKSGPWTQYKARMRQMRARSWALRDGFADVLRGLNIAEEAMDIDPPLRDVTPPSPPPAPAPKVLEAPPAPRQIDTTAVDAPAATKPAATPKPVAAEVPTFPGIADGEAFLTWADKLLATAADPAALEDIFNREIEPKKEGLFPPDLEELAALYQRHERRLGAD